MGSFLKVQNILAQMMWGSTQPASDDTEPESDDTETASDGTRTVSNTAAQRLAHSRNRVPTLGGPYIGPYGMVLPSRGWVRS